MFSNGENFIIKTKYVDAKTHITVVHKICGNQWEVSPDGFFQHLKKDKKECKNCPTKVCKIQDCNSKHFSSGYCSDHYRAFKLYDDPLKRQIKTRKVRSEESAVEELLDFYKENGRFSTNELMSKNSGLERYLRTHHEGLRGFCERLNIDYILTIPKLTSWNNQKAIDTLEKLYLKVKKPINVSVLSEHGLNKLNQWIYKNGMSLTQFCKENNIEHIVKQNVFWNDAKCFRLIKNIYKEKRIKPNGEYIKATKMGAYRYIYEKYDNFKEFVEAFDLQDYVDLSSNMSSGEKEIEGLFNNGGINFKNQYKDDRCAHINPLPFDFVVFNKDSKIKFLLEYDGEQHFMPIDFSGRGEEWAASQFKNIQIKDKIKNDFSIKYKIPLVRLPYWEINNVETILNHILGYFDLIKKQDVDESLVHRFLVNHPDWSHEEYISQVK